MDFSDTDGLYGSKHLAKKWSNSSSIPANKKNDGNETELDRILLFVLLDLIGQASPEFRSYAVSIGKLVQVKYYKVVLPLLG